MNKGLNKIKKIGLDNSGVIIFGRRLICRVLENYSEKEVDFLFSTNFLNFRTNLQKSSKTMVTR